MNKPKDYDNAQAAEAGYRQPVAGPCIFKVVSAQCQPNKDNPELQVLSLQLDIAEGSFKDHYSKLSEKLNKNMYLRVYQGVDGEKSLPHFKRVITAFESSNNFKFTFNEVELEKKIIGGNLREEDYYKRDGSTGSNLKIDYLCSVQSVKNGEHKPMAPKKLQHTQSGNAGFQQTPPETDYNQDPGHTDDECLGF